eukprot:g82218.t1
MEGSTYTRGGSFSVWCLSIGCWMLSVTALGRRCRKPTKRRGKTLNNPFSFFETLPNASSFLSHFSFKPTQDHSRRQSRSPSNLSHMSHTSNLSMQPASDIFPDLPDGPAGLVTDLTDVSIEANDFSGSALPSLDSSVAKEEDNEAVNIRESIQVCVASPVRTENLNHYQGQTKAQGA